MKSHNSHTVGLVFGSFISGLHFVWSVLVFLGLAQPLINFILWAHMIDSLFVVKSFDPYASVTLIVVTFIVGYVLGYVMAFVWNKIHTA